MPPNPVKNRSPRGRTGARATRRAIIDSATVLFVTRGYAATTLADVAGCAGVAVQTVYFHFGNKRTLLKEAVDVAAVGDDEPVPLLQRPGMEEVREQPDPRAAIQSWSAWSREIFERVAPILDVVRQAAGQDQEMAQQWQVNEEERLTAFTELVQLLADRGALAGHLSVPEASDIVFALNSVEVYTLLTARRGWTAAAYETWLNRSLAASLLDNPR